MSRAPVSRRGSLCADHRAQKLPGWLVGLREEWGLDREWREPGNPRLPCRFFSLGPLSWQGPPGSQAANMSASTAPSILGSDWRLVWAV